MGDDVIDHYVHTAEWEQFEFDRRITDLGAQARLRALLRGHQDHGRQRSSASRRWTAGSTPSRRVATKKEIAAAFAAAHAAQEQWKRLPIAERAAYCSAAVDAMIAMTDEIVPELAWQMGRPVRYGAGELRGFEERARYMIAIAEERAVGPRSGSEGRASCAT